MGRAGAVMKSELGTALNFYIRKSGTEKTKIKEKAPEGAEYRFPLGCPLYGFRCPVKDEAALAVRSILYGAAESIYPAGKGKGYLIILKGLLILSEQR